MGEPGVDCAVCAVKVRGFEALAEHFVAQAARSDGAHVMWLNRNVTKYQVGSAELAMMLRRQARGLDTGSPQVRR